MAFNQAQNEAEQWQNASGVNPKIIENVHDDDNGMSGRFGVIRGSN
jgi:hypothetical protein